MRPGAPHMGHSKFKAARPVLQICCSFLLGNCNKSAIIMFPLADLLQSSHIRGQQALGRKLKFATAQHNNPRLQHTFELVLLTFGTLWLPARSLTTNEFRFLFVHAFSDHNGFWCCDSSANETTGLSVP